MITKGTRSVLCSVEVSWGISASVHMILLTRYTLKEIAVIATFVKVIDNFIGADCESFVG